MILKSLGLSPRSIKNGFMSEEAALELRAVAQGLQITPGEVIEDLSKDSSGSSEKYNSGS